jgi:hypothetical protein
LFQGGECTYEFNPDDFEDPYTEDELAMSSGGLKRPEVFTEESHSHRSEMTESDKAAKLSAEEALRNKDI